MKKRDELQNSASNLVLQEKAPQNGAQPPTKPDLIEKLLTLKQAGEILGIPYFKMRRAAKQGSFPVYRFGNSRALVRLSEVDAAINASRDGGHK
jgi:excisionase family DNA binding protein